MSFTPAERRVLLDSIEVEEVLAGYSIGRSVDRSRASAPEARSKRKPSTCISCTQ